jgi:hypothetical protein
LTTDAGDGAKFRYDFGNIEERNLTSEWAGKGRILGFGMVGGMIQAEPTTEMI